MTSPQNPNRPQRKVRRNPPLPSQCEPGQIWVPDIDSPEFAAEAHRQSAAIAASPHEKEDQAFIDAISEFDDD